MKRVLLKLGLVLLGVALTLVAIELVMATWYPQPGAPGETTIGWGNRIHQASEVPGLHYELRPGAEKTYRPKRQQGAELPIHVNRFGMRGREFERVKGDARRVAVLGDSTTFGYGVSDDESYPAVLEALLNDRDPDHSYQVLNFGVAGYGTTEEALVLEHKALPFEPDAIVVGYNLNDPDAEHALEPLYNHFTEPAWWRHFHLTRFVAERQRQRRIATLGGGNPIRYWHVPGRENWATVERGFARIAELAQEAQLPVLVVIFTAGAPKKDPAEYDLRDVHAQVAAEARANGFAVIDTSPIYSALQAAGKKTQFPHQHPTALGQRAAAEAIADWLLGAKGPLGGS